ncbi:MAG: DUF1573 domain-containing protein [Planctomycetota bacterium]|jgi:hypothetical protein
MADGSGSTLSSLVIGAAALAVVGAATLWWRGGPAETDPVAPPPRTGGPVPPVTTGPATLPRTAFTPPGHTARPGADRPPPVAPSPPGLVTSGAEKPVVIPPVEPGKEPVIVFDAQRHHFGTVEQGHSPTAVFRFRNTGKGPLQIVRIHSHCSCAPVLPGRRIIPPGGTGEIRVTFQTLAFTGSVAKTVDVTSNDPATPKVTLVVSADVVREFRFTPDAFAFGTIAPGTTATRTVEVAHSAGKPFRIVEVWGAPASCRVRAEPVEGDAARWRVVFDIPQQTTSMTQAGRVQLRTEPATPQPIWIAYAFAVQPSIELDPWQVNWGTLTPDARPEATVRMRALGGATFTVSAVTVTPRDLVQATATAEGDGWVIRISPGKRWPASGRVRASVRVTTDHLQVPAVIPVHAVVAPQEK